MLRALLAAAAILAGPVVQHACGQNPQKPLAPLPGKATPLNLPKVPAQAAKEPAAEIYVRPEDTIFPSLVIGSAGMAVQQLPDEFALGTGSGDNLAIVRVVAPAADTPVVVTVSCNDVMEPSTFRGTLSKAHQWYAVYPKIRWKYKELLKSRQQMPVDLVFKIKVGDFPEIEHVRTCSLRTLNDCPLWYAVGAQVMETNLAFTAYVNEDHPWVDEILRDAIDSRVVERFLAYQTGNRDDVLKQVYAVWRVLQTRGISYSSITTLSVPQGATMQSQHVRFLDECIVNKQANCIDGTVMIASILRKVGIDSKIVLVPGHAFLAIDLDALGKEQLGLETTMLGKARKEDFDALPSLRKQLTLGNGFDKASWDSFLGALDVGTKRLQQDQAKFGSGKVEDAPYAAIDLGAARQLGVRPIPYVPPAAEPLPKSTPKR